MFYFIIGLHKLDFGRRRLDFRDGGLLTQSKCVGSAEMPHKIACRLLFFPSSSTSSISKVLNFILSGILSYLIKTNTSLKVCVCGGDGVAVAKEKKKKQKASLHGCRFPSLAEGRREERAYSNRRSCALRRTDHPR